MQELRELFIKNILKEISDESSSDPVSVDDFKNEIDIVMNLAKSEGDETLIDQLEQLLTMTEASNKSNAGLIKYLIFVFVMSVIAPQLGLVFTKQILKWYNSDISVAAQKIEKEPRRNREREIKKYGNNLASRIAETIRQQRQY